MKIRIFAFVASALIAATFANISGYARSVPWVPTPGIYTNEEQVYFDGEAGRKTLWISVVVSPSDTSEELSVKLNFVDAFGSKVKPPLPTDQLSQDLWDENTNGVLRLKQPKGGLLRLRRARPATCWAAIPKDKPKADGSPDWYFAKDVKLHDQGGRVRVGGGDTGAPELILRMRNVVWPDKADGTPSSSRPSLVLYVHKPDKPDSAESYVWADPGAARIGINLRWMQASCTIDALDTPSVVTPNTFKR